MKKLITITLLYLFALSCTDVVDIPLTNAAPKIVIEALISWEKGTTGNIQKIKLKTTSSFYSNISPVVSGANITITNSSNTVFVFTEIAGTGEYICNDFIPVLNESYNLKIISNGKTYNATETLKPVAPILLITQEEIIETSDEKDKKIKASFKDPITTEDFYLIKYETPYDIKSDLYVLSDLFFNGNEFFSERTTDKLKSNDIVKITHFGISKAYFEYMNKLIAISSSGQGPFSSPPITLRGNITNVTDNNDFPFGFFALSETDIRNYTVK